MDERTDPYTTTELAEAAGVSNTYVRRLVREGQLEGKKMGRDWLIPAGVGRAWLDKRRQQGEKA
jgi:excisionase family DNA binding protein